MSDNIGHELNWDDTIEKDNGEFVLLPAGDYNFVVEGFERGRHGGSDKLPPCNKAILRISIDAPEGPSTLTHNLFLHSKTEGMLSAFFSGIGQKKKGEKLAMNWNTVVGATGKLKLGKRDYTGKDGETRQSNEIIKFYPREDASGKPFEAGRF